MWVIRPIVTGEELLGCVCMRRTTSDEADHSLRRDLGVSKQGRRSVGEWFRMKSLETLQDFVNDLRANHAFRILM